MVHRQQPRLSVGPRVDHVQTEIRKIPTIARDHTQAIPRGGRTQKTVNGWQWAACGGHQATPAICHLSVDCQNAAGKKPRRVCFEPIRQSHAPFGIFHPFDAFTQFAQRQHTQKQAGCRSARKPLDHTGVWRLVAKLRQDIRIEQIAQSDTSRVKLVVRSSVMSSASTSGDRRINSTRECSLPVKRSGRYLSPSIIEGVGSERLETASANHCTDFAGRR